MSRIVRIALTETRNAYADMPARTEDLGQLSGKLDAVRDANLRHHEQLIADAAAAGARLVGLGELFPGPYFARFTEELWRGLAEDALAGPSISAMCAAAKRHAVIIVAPIYELDGTTGKRFNTAVVIDESGGVLGKYRKTHIPEGENERGEFHERFYYGPSNGELGEWPANISKNRFFPVFETSIGNIGAAVCYDRHFAGVMSTLASEGAELILSPAVTYGEKSQRMWEQEFEVDACRHNVFIAGSNRRGSEPPWNDEYFGASYIVGPNGRIPRVDSRPELVIGDVDFDVLIRPDPSGWNLPRDRRPEIYSK
jgi:N-carbamoylputrescine amidase